MWNCKHCKQDFDFNTFGQRGNHSRHCDKNPNKKNSYKKLTDLCIKRYGNFKDFEVSCYECKNNFLVNKREKLFLLKDKYFCSRSCANKVGLRAKIDKYNYDEVASYKTVAWRYHEKKCVVCNENNVVEVHHFNENHDDNRKENLVPLCPTHHRYMHGKHRNMICEKIEQYIQNKWG